jgi:hypothetical protein
MTAYAIIVGGIVANIAEADEAFAQENGWIPAQGGAIGDLWDGETFTRPEPAVVVPQVVSARQGMAELIDRDLVPTVQAVLDAIPGKEGALARNDFLKAAEWERTWPLIVQLQPVLGWSDAFVDEMFISAAKR